MYINPTDAKEPIPIWLRSNDCMYPRRPRPACITSPVNRLLVREPLKQCKIRICNNVCASYCCIEVRAMTMTRTLTDCIHKGSCHRTLTGAGANNFMSGLLHDCHCLASDSWLPWYLFLCTLPTWTFQPCPLLLSLGSWIYRSSRVPLCLSSFFRSSSPVSVSCFL